MFFDIDNFQTSNSRLPNEKPSRYTYLVEIISEFYSWYMFWDSRMEDRGKIYEIISRMLRIITISHDVGDFLSKQEEEMIGHSFENIKDTLYHGKIKIQELPYFLNLILERVVEGNAKAKLVDAMTLIEYRYLLEAQLLPEKKLSHEIREGMDYIISKITPELPSIHATAVAKNLRLLMKDKIPLETLPENLRLAYKNWL